MPFFPNGIVCEEMSRRGEYHLHRAMKDTFRTLLGPNYYQGDIQDAPQGESRACPFKLSISPSTARNWMQQTALRDYTEAGEALQPEAYFEHSISYMSEVGQRPQIVKGELSPRGHLLFDKIFSEVLSSHPLYHSTRDTCLSRIPVWVRCMNPRR